jgi:hypothetical protein
VSEQIHVTWNADIQDGKTEGFKELAKKWAALADEDPETNFSRWTITEDGKSVRLDAVYASASATMAQFGKNLWGELDNYLKPSGMIVSGPLSEELDFLRSHGAQFTVPIEE